MKGCPDCKAPWHWEQMQGMRLFRTVGRRKIYRVQCPKCLVSAEVTSGGKPIQGGQTMP